MENNLLKIEKERLYETIRKATKKYDNKRDRSRFLSIFIKTATTILGGAAAVLLGWRINSKSVEGLTNVALICTALIPIMNTAETFFCLSKRWTSYKKIYNMLKYLGEDFRMEKRDDQTIITEYSERLNSILRSAKDEELLFHERK